MNLYDNIRISLKEDDMKKVGFIGAGNMGSAILKAVSKNEKFTAFATDHNLEKAKALKEETGCGILSNSEIAKICDYIFLGVKPYMLEDTIKSILPEINERKDSPVFVSMVCGLEIEKIVSWFGKDVQMIRIMPNTPVAIGEGMTVYTGNVSDDTEKEFLDMMKYSGVMSKLDEAHFDQATAVSGCGPAFVDLFVEALADGGVLTGLKRDDALKYAAQMVKGSADLILKSGKHPGKLKDEVCSPGGATIEGVRVLEESAFRGAVMDAVIACFEKSRGMK